ncbi:MAG: J domain-containing protein [Alphaproteobacteria bacterium]|nr:J domain-containing protein [Alphaproteobacteria bacterium]
MFERNKVDNPSTVREKAIHVELSMDDGRLLKGRFFVPSTRKVYEELNGQGSFLDFQSYDGDREMISKACLRAVRLTDIPRAKGLAARTINDDFDPHAILNVTKGAQWEEIRESYHQLSKLYHPDRYANTNLPEEISNYIDTMARRINAAFSALEKPQQVKREFTRAKTEPIYQRG